MPNWCTNNATFENDNPEMIRRLVEGFNKGELFSTFLPCPKELSEGVAPADESATKTNIEKHGFADWYQWCLNNWGTKWDVGNEDVEVEPSDDGRSVRLFFDSAWSPPLAFYQAMEERFGFKIAASYFEPGMAFVGEYVDGDEETYEIDPENLDEIPENLRAEFDIDMWYDNDEDENLDIDLDGGLSATNESEKE